MLLLIISKMFKDYLILNKFYQVVAIMFFYLKLKNLNILL